MRSKLNHSISEIKAKKYDKITLMLNRINSLSNMSRKEFAYGKVLERGIQKSNETIKPVGSGSL